jgi:hypothetical protein
LFDVREESFPGYQAGGQLNSPSPPSSSSTFSTEA